MRNVSLLRFAVGVLAGAAALTAQTRSAELEEPPFTLKASEILTAELLRGEHHQVTEDVANDGFMNIYTIESEWGTFEAEGTEKLRQRIRELDAIAQLEEVTRSKAFVDAVGQKLARDARTLKEVATNPVATAKGVPGGVKRLMKRTSRQASDLSDTAKEGYADYKEDKDAESSAEEEGAEGESGEPGPEGEASGSEENDKSLTQKGVAAGESYAKKWSGYTGARRKYARELEVDPYTDNEPLNKELYRVAQAASAGHLTMRFVPVPSSGVVDMLGDVDSLVWDMDPLDLRMHNEQILYGMGLSEAQVEALYENPHQTPTTITVLVDALTKLEGVEGRGLWIDSAAAVDSGTVASFLVRAVNFYAEYHEQRMALRSFSGGDVYPQGIATDGRVVVALPVDHLHWTAEIKAVVENRTAELAAESGARTFEAWIEGGCSEMARAALEGLGYEVHTGSFAGLDVTFGES